MVGIRMGSDHIIQMINSQIVQIIYDLISIFIFAGVDEHCMLSLKDQRRVSLIYVDEMHL